VCAYAEAAAGYEFESFSVYGDLGDLPPYAMLHANANQLKDSPVLRIGPMGVPVGMQHPEITAAHAIALEEQLPGQTYAGLVRGAFLDQIGEVPASLARLEEAVAVIRQRTAERGICMPICLGGFGPKLLSLAGRLAVDGVKLGGSTNPNLAIKAREAIGNSSTEIVLGAVSVIDPNRKAARCLARHEVAKYLRVVGHLDTTLDEESAASLATFNTRFDNGDPQASDAISDLLLDKFALAGTPQDALAALESMHGKVDRFEFGTPHGLANRAEAVRYIGKTIIKELRN
jgi:5,10-methylenetetrahydromethanopterin reductase